MDDQTYQSPIPPELSAALLNQQIDAEQLRVSPRLAFIESHDVGYMDANGKEIDGTRCPLNVAICAGCGGQEENHPVPIGHDWQGHRSPSTPDSPPEYEIDCSKCGIVKPCEGEDMPTCPPPDEQ